MEVNSIEELVMHGEQYLQNLADTGNSIATEWLAKVQAESVAMKKLSLFGDLKIALMRDVRVEAVAVRQVLFPGN